MRHTTRFIAAITIFVSFASHASAQQITGEYIVGARVISRCSDQSAIRFGRSYAATST